MKTTPLESLTLFTTSLELVDDTFGLCRTSSAIRDAGVLLDDETADDVLKTTPLESLTSVSFELVDTAGLWRASLSIKDVGTTLGFFVAGSLKSPTLRMSRT